MGFNDADNIFQKLFIPGCYPDIFGVCRTFVTVFADNDLALLQQVPDNRAEV